jgi:hypothetical protein
MLARGGAVKCASRIALSWSAPTMSQGTRVPAAPPPVAQHPVLRDFIGSTASAVARPAAVRREAGGWRLRPPRDVNSERSLRCRTLALCHATFDRRRTARDPLACVEPIVEARSGRRSRGRGCRRRHGVDPRARPTTGDRDQLFCRLSADAGVLSRHDERLAPREPPRRSRPWTSRSRFAPFVGSATIVCRHLDGNSASTDTDLFAPSWTD